MSLLPTLLAGAGGGGGGSGSVTGIILSPAVAATIATLTVTYANGSGGQGATLTNAGTQAAFAVDGQTLAVGARVLIKNQTSALQNGVYQVTTAGTGATNWVLTRVSDFNQPSQMTAGTLVEVINGTVNAGTVWQLTTTVAAVGTNNVSFISINITTKVDQNGSPIYAADSGAADAYVITLVPAPSAYTTGMVVRFKASAANATATPTINVNGLGAKTIVKRVNTALAANDILANQFIELVYDGANFVLWTQFGNASGAGTVTSVSGTANQVDSTGGTTPVLSLSSTLVAPGTVTLNADPVSALQAVTKQYADAISAGIDFKQAVLAASTVALTVTYSNGVAGIGATLTNATTQAAFAIDGQTIAVGGRVLIKNQASTFQNGIYSVTNAGSGATNWVLTRTSDYNTVSSIFPGTLVPVDNGSVNAATSWLETATVVTIGTDPITFTQFTYGAYSVLQSGAPIYAADTGAANAYAITLSPAPSAYVSGMTVRFLATNANTTASTLNVNGLGVKSITKFGSVALGANDILAGQDVEVIYDGTRFQMLSVPSSVPNFYVQGRLTLTTAVPITTTDVSAAGTLYFTPYKGNWLSLYTSGAWRLYTFTELSIAAPAAANQMYDVFVYDSSGTLTLELIAWTSDTARATALVLQNGVLTKSGSTDRLYLGSVRTKTASQFNNTLAFRHIWNYYNRVHSCMLATDATDTWTYTTAAYRQANANAANQLDMVIGYSEDIIEANVLGIAQNTNNNVTFTVGIGVDSTTVTSATLIGFNAMPSASITCNTNSFYKGYPGIGRHTLVWLEYSNAVGTTTWFGDGGAPTVIQAGISGTILN